MHQMGCVNDFIKLLSCKAALPANLYGEIHATDLTKTVQGAALLHLLHLCLSCIGVEVLKCLIHHQCSVHGLPVNIGIRDDFNCPIYLRLKSQTVTNRPRANLVLHIKGASFHMDFGFFNVPSVRGFQSFLIIFKSLTSCI